MGPQPITYPLENLVDAEFPEEWEIISGFEEYEVSTYGRVRSWKKRQGVRIIKQPNPKIMALRIDTRGYKLVRLCVNGRHFNKTVHRLVASAFIPNPENKPQVNHINGQKTDPHVTNLEWCTGSENCQHALDSELYLIARGDRNDPRARITVDQARQVKIRRAAGESRSLISKDLGITYSTIANIDGERAWAYVKINN